MEDTLKTFNCEVCGRVMTYIAHFQADEKALVECVVCGIRKTVNLVETKVEEVVTDVKEEVPVVENKMEEEFEKIKAEFTSLESEIKGV